MGAPTARRTVRRRRETHSRRWRSSQQRATHRERLKVRSERVWLACFGRSHSSSRLFLQSAPRSPCCRPSPLPPPPLIARTLAHACVDPGGVYPHAPTAGPFFADARPHSWRTRAHTLHAVPPYRPPPPHGRRRRSHHRDSRSARLPCARARARRLLFLGRAPLQVGRRQLCFLDGGRQQCGRPRPLHLGRLDCGQAQFA